MQKFVSAISNLEFPIEQKVAAKSIRESIFNLIKDDFPNFSKESNISIDELNKYRDKYVTTFFSEQIGELSAIEKTIVDAINQKIMLTDYLEDEENNTSLTIGQRLADKVATLGGSWTFIISFLLFLVVWILINVIFFLNKGFDPYPFILLNLILSCIAAIQAPIIMMSQNRQEEKDRDRAKKDYMINMKSEMEIRILHDKIDHIIINQQQDMLEIQKIQIDMMKEILNKINTSN